MLFFKSERKIILDKFYLSLLSSNFNYTKKLDNNVLQKKIIEISLLNNGGIYINNDLINYIFSQQISVCKLMESLNLINKKKNIFLEIDQIGLNSLTDMFSYSSKANNLNLVINPEFFYQKKSKKLVFDFYFNYINDSSFLPLLIKMYPLLNFLDCRDRQLNNLINSQNIKGLIFNLEMAQDFDLETVIFVRKKFDKLMLSDLDTMAYPLFKNGIDGIITDFSSRNYNLLSKLKNSVINSDSMLAKSLQLKYNVLKKS